MTTARRVKRIRRASPPAAPTIVVGSLSPADARAAARALILDLCEYYGEDKPVSDVLIGWLDREGYINQPICDAGRVALVALKTIFTDLLTPLPDLEENTDG